VAGVINCQPHDVPILVAARLLKPLGKHWHEKSRRGHVAAQRPE
jgi:hypothetical protein